MLKKAFFALMLTACAKHVSPSPPPPNMYDLSGYPGPTFDATNSPCLDGLLVNLGNSCETLVEVKGRGVITTVQCSQAKDKNSEWDKYTFVVVTDHSIGAPPGTREFCVDPVTVVYFRERS
jgi:hypothetical protein